MFGRTTCLIDIAEIVAKGQSRMIDEAVKAAYRSGANREDLLSAVEIARRIGSPEEAALARAYAAIHDWHWMVARRCKDREALVASRLNSPATAAA